MSGVETEAVRMETEITSFLRVGSSPDHSGRVILAVEKLVVLRT